MRHRIVGILIILLCLTCKLQAQKSYTIIEVFLDKDTVETFDYKLNIISKGDTLCPIVKEKYFLPSMKLDTFVSMIIFYKDKKIVINHIDNIFFHGANYIKVRLSTIATDGCIKVTDKFADMVHIWDTKCEQYNEITFVHLSIYECNDFYTKWKTSKR